ncbi:hypothetical protein Aduo_018186 [Ancylostoma duodenale]
MATVRWLIRLCFTVTVAAELHSSGYFAGINEFGERPDCPGLFGHKYRACPHPLNSRWKCIRHVDICNGVVDCPDAWDEDPVVCQFRWDFKGGSKKANYHASYDIGGTREQLLQVKTGCIEPHRKQRASLREPVNLSSGKLRKDDEECPELFGQKQRMCPKQSINEAVKCIRWTDLCDGKSDCPDGYDEISSNCVAESAF